MRQVAIARVTLRVNSNLAIVCLSPWLGSARRPDCLVLNSLPFTEDLRIFRFTPLAELQPEVGGLVYWVTCCELCGVITHICDRQPALLLHARGSRTRVLCPVTLCVGHMV